MLFVYLPLVSSIYLPGSEYAFIKQADASIPNPTIKEKKKTALMLARYARTAWV